MAYPMKLIQVILYLTSVSHLVYCCAIQRDLNTYVSPNCTEELVDIEEFNNIFINLTRIINDSKSIKIHQKTIDFLSEKSIDNPTDQLDRVTQSICEKFSVTCIQYTDVMTHKHELQHIIFTMEDALSDLTVISTDITHVIIQLERAAFKLQNMMLRHHNKPCVEFTGAQYRGIYTEIARLRNKSNVYDSLFISVAHWGDKTDNCSNFKKLAI